MAIRGLEITARHIPTGVKVRLTYARSMTEGKRMAALWLRSVVAAGPAPSRAMSAWFRTYDLTPGMERIRDRRTGAVILGPATVGDIVDRGNLPSPFYERINDIPR